MSGGMVAPGSPWSPQQRRWLQALGHAVYRAADGEPVAEDAPPPMEGAASVATEPRTPDRPVPRPRPPMEADRAPAPAPMPAADAAAAVPPRSTGMRRPVRLPDRLQLAMLRASGLDPADPAAQAAMAQWPVERLRGDPAAKRAFWPQLRALRRRP